MTHKRNKFITLVLALVAAIILVACSNEADDTKNSTAANTSEQSADVETVDVDDDSDDDTDSSSESDDTDDDTDSSDKADDNDDSADSASLTKTMKLVDGTEITYRYKTTVKPGEYSKVVDEDEAEEKKVSLVVTVNEDGTFSIGYPYNVFAQSNPDGSFDINTSVEGGPEDEDYYGILNADGTYGITTRKGNYGIDEGGTFTANINNETQTGADFQRYYDLLEENDLMTIQDLTGELEEIIDLIEETFGE